MWFNSENEGSQAHQYQQQVDQIKSLLTELLEIVRQGSLDSRHSSDILKIIKRDMFGDYTFELAERFVTSGSLQKMASHQADL